jgi:hypothetical protein
MASKSATAVLERPEGGEVFRLAESLRRLSDLYHNLDEYEPGFGRPTQAAYDFTWRLLAETAEQSRAAALNAYPSTLGDGGVVVEFLGGPETIRLIVPPGVDGTYVYSGEAIHPAEAPVLGKLISRAAE